MKTAMREIQDWISDRFEIQEILVDLDNGIIRPYKEEDRDILIRSSKLQSGRLILKIWRVDKDVNNVDPYTPERYKWKGGVKHD